MATNGADAVIVGGGIVGVATAYCLGKAGIKSIMVEKDSIGSHASGFAAGGLGPLSGAGIPGPVFPLAHEGMRIHKGFSRALSEETGTDTQYRPMSYLALAFTEEEVREGKAVLPWQQAQEGYKVRWLEPAEIKDIEPRVSDLALGGVYGEGMGSVEPYRFTLALSQAAEKLGATVRHGRATGLKREGARVTSVVLDSGEIPCDRVVLSMGPWSGEASSWLDVPIKVSPLKGQILRLRAPGAPLGCTVGWAGNYATTKPDGLLYAGTTEEDVGFDENLTVEGRDSVMASLLKMIPAVTDAELVLQTACLRPLAADMLPILGAVPGWEGVYAATGAGRKGILLGPAMGRITADLITKGSSDIPIEAFDPGRFAK